MTDINIIEDYDKKEQIRTLLSEYISEIISSDDSIKKVLRFQNFEEEFNNLEKKYYPPNGKIFIAYYKNELAGCVAITKLDMDKCELKRLYVRPKYRSKKLGYKLIFHAIEEAKKLHYKSIYLDSIKGVMDKGIRLYESMGFEYTYNYNGSSIKKIIHMKLNL
ncbi:GNAT family N-acetyltransferase [Peptostreptococcus equinus]|uniref:GNAT family N-acetyltransferase n=1 Tax=Peptostreptococcus equinus TaxID=3003601 RepID=A0ABY7JTJ9_9FIRM|nr:GNAT family N-acetyltransferase [Peptostreptococcus sp. CBA3647]WAW15393.1 GNAT family N-acetyltransferase [Peptostreptococcus sp. CBA3647]